jgi:hypothetical protein
LRVAVVEVLTETRLAVVEAAVAVCLLDMQALLRVPLTL